jgi:hypothetical protein
LGVQHWPLWQTCPACAHVLTPQVPLQPSLPPQVVPLHDGVQTHTPAALQPWPAGQVPQLPMQPSGPHCLPVQAFVQPHKCKP